MTSRRVSNVSAYVALGALATVACASPRQEWPGPGPQPPPAPVPSEVAPPMPVPPVASSPSATSPDTPPSESATSPTTTTPKARHQETVSYTARAASQSQACDQAKMGADSTASNKCGSGRALGKSFAPCSCMGTTIVVTCTANLTIVCEDK